MFETHAVALFALVEPLSPDTVTVGLITYIDDVFGVIVKGAANVRVLVAPT